MYVLCIDYKPMIRQAPAGSIPCKRGPLHKKEQMSDQVTNWTKKTQAKSHSANFMQFHDHIWLRNELTSQKIRKSYKNSRFPRAMQQSESKVPLVHWTAWPRPRLLGTSACARLANLPGQSYGSGMLRVYLLPSISCQEENIVIRNAGRALFTLEPFLFLLSVTKVTIMWPSCLHGCLSNWLRNLQGFGATVGCFQVWSSTLLVFGGLNHRQLQVFWSELSEKNRWSKYVRIRSQWQALKSGLSEDVKGTSLRSVLWVRSEYSGGWLSEHRQVCGELHRVLHQGRAPHTDTHCCCWCLKMFWDVLSFCH